MPKAKKTTLIKREADRIKDLVKDSEVIRKAESLIQNIAFMSITLDELQAEINRAGTIETYQHGKYQSGVKVSSAVQAYNSIMKNFIPAVKALYGLLPESVQEQGRTNSLLELLKKPG